MLTSPIYRHAKPFIKPIVTSVPISPVRYTDTMFSTSIVHTPMNLGVFDVIDANGRVLDRVGNANGPEYVQENGRITCKVAGEYLLRVFDNIHAQDAVTIKIEPFTFSDGSRGVMGVKFWPEILSQPPNAAARLSQNNDGISVICRHAGQYAFAYRYRNYLGQVSEQSCVYVTAVA